MQFNFSVVFVPMRGDTHRGVLFYYGHEPRLSDSENAIKIQIWCSLIADLLLKIVKKAAAARWSFSNLAAMVRLHLLTYINIFNFLKSPEKSLLKLFSKPVTQNYNQLSCIT